MLPDLLAGTVPLPELDWITEPLPSKDNHIYRPPPNSLPLLPFLIFMLRYP